MFVRILKRLNHSALHSNKIFNHCQIVGLKYLTQPEVDKYKNDGYTVAKDVLSTDEVIDCRKALEELIDRSRDVAESNNVFEIMDGHSPATPKLNRVRFPSEHHDVFMKLLHNTRMLDAVEDCIGSSFRYMPQDKLNVKPAGDGDAIRWHQDWAFFPHTNDSVLTASVLLYDTSRENGCLQCIPKSHKGPVVSHYQNGIFVNTITDKNFQASPVEYIEGKAGSVTIHNARLIHGSAKNTSITPRSTVCFIFNAMDAWPLLGVAGEDFGNIGPVSFKEFNKTLIRGDICFQPRMENIPVSLPVPFEEASSVFRMQIDVEEPQP